MQHPSQPPQMGVQVRTQPWKMTKQFTNKPISRMGFTTDISNMTYTDMNNADDSRQLSGLFCHLGHFLLLRTTHICDDLGVLSNVMIRRNSFAMFTKKTSLFTKKKCTCWLYCITTSLWRTPVNHLILEQGYVKERLKSSLRKFYGRYGDLIKQYEVSLSQMLNDIL